jgi:hypothetical protein
MEFIEEKLFNFILKEASNATRKFGHFHSPHEAYGVLKEEFEEWWDSIKSNTFDDYELLQMVSVGFRYLVERMGEDQIRFDSIDTAQHGRWDNE